ncbi:hypothetical protein D3C72_668940 [compost metagenome]
MGHEGVVARAQALLGHEADVPEVQQAQDRQRDADVECRNLPAADGDGAHWDVGYPFFAFLRPMSMVNLTTETPDCSLVVIWVCFSSGASKKSECWRLRCRNATEL